MIVRTVPYKGKTKQDLEVSAEACRKHAELYQTEWLNGS